MKIISLPFAITLIAALFPGVVTRAFPPAPHHVIYGLVRDQFGVPMQVLPTDVYLVTPAGAELRGNIVGDLAPGVNYRIEVPMDSGTAADTYQPTALRPFFQFKLKVKIGATTYLPMEMAGNFAQIGQPGQQTRIDLTLGVDSDGDGLPDGWEEAMIAIYGGTLATIKPNEDNDGDGISNINEYLTGTYAFDPTEGFMLDLVEIKVGASQLEFMAIRGRTYTIHTSTDLSAWTPIDFRLVSASVPGVLQNEYKATDTRVIRVEAPVQPGPITTRFFKAMVQ